MTLPSLNRRADSLNRRAAKLIVPDCNLTTDQKMEKAGILSLENQFLYNKGIFMHNIWYEKTPAYLSHFFKRSQSSYGSYNRLYILPKTNKDIFKQSLSFAGASFWNKLPTDIKNIQSLSSFKVKLSKFLMPLKEPLITI